MKKMYLFGFIITLAVILFVAATESTSADSSSCCTWEWVDVRDYITQDTPGFHLCDTRFSNPDWNLCTDGHWGVGNEFRFTYSHGIVGWIARTSSTSLVGPIRNIDPYMSGEQHRCFSNPSQPCTAPSNTSFPPQGIPGAFYAPRPKSLSVGIPLDLPSYRAITVPLYSGEDSFHGGWHDFGVNVIDPNTCQQTFRRNVKRRVSYWLAPVNFGGDIGFQQDVLIVDHEESYPNDPTDEHPEGHLERYFYVKGYGQVAGAGSQDMDGDFVYGEGQEWNSVRHKIMPGDTDFGVADFCPQGGAGWDW